MRFLFLSFVLLLSGCDDASGGDDAGTVRIDAGDVDAGIDCSLIGCGAPVVCGETCDAPCGCCSCGEDDEMSIDGASYVCTGGCWQATLDGRTCASSDECTPGFSCCYPCGVADCDNICEPTCEGGEPDCIDGCLARQ